MNAAPYALLCLAAAAANVAAVGEKMKCSTYAAVGAKGFTCNDRSDIICTEGCKSFVTITNCTLPSYPKKPVTTELCTIGYGRDTAAAKACITGQGSFRCTGTTTGYGSCFGCVPYDKVSWAK
ncbi:hypothetical protein PTTG_11693 [Puccinia triticina 1-1 BBBD Race 1]|uniref:Secreted protein n=2 Tax=Puccinia triticina TaxID=208348 RepID=A0A180G4R7_PUCT1|nr:uncharacterized protein PtA15_8A466 [Puccinia triticina]OAV87608.1 hypothetical protein PTTG_11693 [Puccinia triticina 1-1 BBBD Race 1]WAQ87562.1 hypothetical protein PtA15_8A466 [Puccinia triticina]WAR57411.1 hypothetical protein PtB15_8B458 [Puccinia triticina]